MTKIRPKSLNFIRRLILNFSPSSHSFEIWLIIRVRNSQQMQNFSSVSSKLCQLSQKNTGTWGVIITIVERKKWERFSHIFFNYYELFNIVVAVTLNLCQVSKCIFFIVLSFYFHKRLISRSLIKKI